MITPHPRAVRNPRVVPWLAGLPVLLGLAGCGQSSTPGWALSPTGAASPTIAAASASSTMPEAPTTTPAPASSAATASTGRSSIAAPPAAASEEIDVRDLDQVSFASPSGRIQCGWSHIDGKGSMTCAVEGADWTPKPGTPACDLSEGDEASLDDSGAGQLTCHGDTTLGVAVLGQASTSWSSRPHAATATWHGQNVAAVPYDTTILLGDAMSCTSRTSGLTCTNRAGHGFTVAREGYSVS